MSVDLYRIKGLAKDAYINFPLRAKVEGIPKKLDAEDMRILAIYEGVLNYLNSEGVAIPERFFVKFEKLTSEVKS